MHTAAMHISKLCVCRSAVSLSESSLCMFAVCGQSSRGVPRINASNDSCESRTSPVCWPRSTAVASRPVRVPVRDFADLYGTRRSMIQRERERERECYDSAQIWCSMRLC